MSTAPENSPRLAQLQHWLATLPAPFQGELSVASADASFRRYFRLSNTERSFIVMDAPPDKEDVRPFLRVTDTLRRASVAAPEIFARDELQGFLLLQDFGHQPLLGSLNQDTVDELYKQSLDTLAHIQQADCSDLPAYDAALLQREMDLFSEWYLGRQLGLALTAAEQRALQQVCVALIESALEQPQVFVHRDYHSRNLMLTADGTLGVIDYQDAVAGAISYDLVSLLRDCYIDWPAPRVQAWALDFLRAQPAVPAHQDDATLLRWFDWMGAQRHIKVLGIFSRLHLRDGKPGYLGDMPRTLSYLLDVAAGYEALSPLTELAERYQLTDRTRELAG